MTGQQKYMKTRNIKDLVEPRTGLTLAEAANRKANDSGRVVQSNLTQKKRQVGSNRIKTTKLG